MKSLSTDQQLDVSAGARQPHPAQPLQPPQRRHPRKRLASVFAIVLMGVLALLLSGCVGMTMESTFNEDGSARHSVRTTIEKESLAQLEEMTAGFEDFGATPEPGATPEDDGTDDPADTFEISDEDLQALRDAGFDAERIDTEDELGLMIARDFPADTSLTDAFNELIRAGSEDDAESDADMPLGAIAGALTRDGDTWTLDLNIDSDSLFETEEETGDASATPDPLEPEFDLESMGIDFDIEYIANFPYEVTETNGERIVGEEQRVRWELPMTGTTALNALVNANRGGGGGGSSRLPWIIGGIVLAALGGAFIAVMMARRNTPPTAAAGAGAAGPVGTPPAPYTAPTSDAPYAPAPPTVQSPPPAQAPQANSWTPPASAPTGPWNPPPPNTPAS